MFLVVRTAHGQTSAPAALTEQQAVDRAMRRAGLVRSLQGAVQSAQGQAYAIGRPFNPQLTYLREQTFGPYGTGEDYLSVAQVFDLGGRRGLRAQAGEVRVEALRHEGTAVQRRVAVDTRLRYFEALHRSKRVEALRSWVTRVDAALVLVTRREGRGDAARYDRRRLERERALAEGRLESELGALEGQLARLGALVGLTPEEPAWLALSGELLPDRDPPPLPELQAQVARRPDLLSLRARAQAADLDRKAASRWWLPELRLELGWKGVNLGQQGRTDGFLTSATLVLPVWDRSQGLAQQAEGEAIAARGAHEVQQGEVRTELAGQHAEAIRLRRAAQRFHTTTASTSGDLVRIASAGYEGGELGVLELLDAFRGAVDDELTALDMAMAARRARLELDRLAIPEAP